MSKVKSVFAFGSLLVGCLIYLFYRQDTFLISFLPDGCVPDAIFIQDDSLFTYWFLYCLADGLWFYSLLQFQLLMYTGKVFSGVLLVFSVLLPFILELMQCIGCFAGTFDWWDVVTYVLTLSIIIWINKKQIIGMCFKLPYS